MRGLEYLRAGVLALAAACGGKAATTVNQGSQSGSHQSEAGSASSSGGDDTSDDGSASSSSGGESIGDGSSSGGWCAPRPYAGLLGG